MINPLLALIDGHIAERQAARSSSLTDEARERALAVFVASARAGHAGTLERLAALREENPVLAERIDALIAAEPMAETTSAEALAAERGLGEAQRAAAGEPDGETGAGQPPAPNAHPRPAHEAGGGIPEEMADVPAPSAWAVEMYGPEAARAQMQAAKHPDESPAEFEARLRRYRQAGKAAERFAEKMRPPNPDESSGWMA
jgi:hypothetical protein